MSLGVIDILVVNYLELAVPDDPVLYGVRVGKSSYLIQLIIAAKEVDIAGLK